ncbi:MAG TPA: sulfotransferase domain-containing protein [Bacteroidia bacterium]|nr:sulfotransferase domain-containing protein [Bacteroidia bacterium]
MNSPQKYLIIGGSTKCGTTSVFNYFEFHPAICRCRLKESRFFLEPAYQIAAAERRHRNISFASLFNGCKPGQTGLEATPDYLYSETALSRIQNELPEAQMVFILRDPVERLISWFRFARMNGLIDQKLSFDDYVQMQNSAADTKHLPQQLKSLQQGNYFPYLQRYIQSLGSNRVGVFLYEQLASEPELFCKSICSYSQLDPEYFTRFDFKIYNRSAETKSPGFHMMFRRLKRSVRPATRKLPEGLRKKLKLAGHSLEATVVQLNAGASAQPVQPSKATLKFLHAYYKESNHQLSEYLKIDLPWASE